MIAFLLAAALAFPYPADLIAVTDADTLRLRVHLGFDVAITVAIRLADIDAPELRTPEGRRAKAAVEQRLQDCPITVMPTGQRTFARYVGIVTACGEDLADWLRAHGHEKKR